jgi:non-canonical poly(A) RNA polymerase PAPD5/7
MTPLQEDELFAELNALYQQEPKDFFLKAEEAKDSDNGRDASDIPDDDYIPLDKEPLPLAPPQPPTLSEISPSPSHKFSHANTLQSLQKQQAPASSSIKCTVRSGDIGDDFISLEAFEEDVIEVENEHESADADAGAEAVKTEEGMREEASEDADSSASVMIVNASNPSAANAKKPRREENTDAKGKAVTPPAASAAAPKRAFIQKKAPWLKKANGQVDGQRYGFLSAPSGRRLHFSERLHRELVDFAEFLSPTAAEAAARAQVVRRVDDVVRRLFGGDKKRVECFGSFETQLYLPTSDIDLVVVDVLGSGSGSESNTESTAFKANAHGNAFAKDPSLSTALGGVEVKVRPPLRKLARALIQAGIAVPSTMQVISRARVPIIKYTDRATGFAVDVSFDISSGLDGARFLKQQMLKQPALRPLILFLKHFLSQRGLNEVFRGGLGSFSVACLVLSFLQVHPLVQLGLVRPEENLGVILVELVELYGKHLNYERVGISVGIDSEAKGVQAMGSGGRTASPLETSIGYYDKIDFGFYSEAKPHLLSILDPQNPENDLARPSFAIVQVRLAFEHAFNVLQAAAMDIDLQAQMLNEDDRGSRSLYNRTDGSILAALVSIPDKTIQHRAHLASRFK